MTALETGSINPAEMEAIGRVLHDRLTRTMVTGRFSITLVYGAEVLRRFDRHRRRLERVADRMYGAGHSTPWINVAHLLLGVSPDAFDYD